MNLLKRKKKAELRPLPAKQPVDPASKSNKWQPNDYRLPRMYREYQDDRKPYNDRG